MEQQQLIARLQNIALDNWCLMYPDTNIDTIPLVIALPSGIHPYNRASGYYDSAGNAIVLYQDLGQAAIQNPDDLDVLQTIRHELAHCHQHKVQGYSDTSTVNAHRHKTWREACYLASVNLWPEHTWTREQFQPFTSKRVNGKPVRIARPKSLTDTELHHWPRSIPEYLSRSLTST